MEPEFIVVEKKGNITTFAKVGSDLHQYYINKKDKPEKEYIKLMEEVPINQISNMTDGAAVQSIRGIISEVKPRTSKMTRSNKEYHLQQFKLSNGNTDVKCALFDWDNSSQDLCRFDGKEVILKAPVDKAIVISKNGEYTNLSLNSKAEIVEASSDYHSQDHPPQQPSGAAVQEREQRSENIGSSLQSLESKQTLKKVIFRKAIVLDTVLRAIEPLKKEYAMSVEEYLATARGICAGISYAKQDYLADELAQDFKSKYYGAKAVPEIEPAPPTPEPSAAPVPDIDDGVPF